MSSLRNDLIEICDDVRSIPGEMDERLFTVEVITRTWTGDRVGKGAVADSSVEILVSDGTTRPRVKQVSQKDIVASGGLYSARDLRVGPISPEFQTDDSSGGTDTTTLSPPQGKDPTETFWKLTGPGLDSKGAYFDKIGEEFTDLKHSYFVILRATARKP